MKKPDVHVISIATIGDKEYIIDVGYAAPFFKPLPRYWDHDFIIKCGYEKYIVKPRDEFGRTRVEQHFNNELQHWYVVNPQQREIGEFRDVIKDSYSDAAVFMNAVRITTVFRSWFRLC
jgi:hypothetical protein